MTIERYLRQNVYNNPVNNPPSTSASSLTSASADIHRSFISSPFNILAVFLILAVIIRLILIVNDYRRSIKRKMICLQLSPNHQDNKSLEATEQLFNVLHSLNSKRTIMPRILRPESHLSLEIVSNKENGIRFIIRLQASEMKVYMRHLKTFMPDIEITQFEDYFNSQFNKDNIGILDFKPKNHFAFPLGVQTDITNLDPFAYLLNSLNLVEDHGLIAYQIVLTSANPNEAINLSRRLSHKTQIIGRNLITGLIVIIIKLVNTVISIIAARLGIKIHASSKLASNNEDHNKLLASKLDGPLFRANLRLMTYSDQINYHQIVEAIVSTFDAVTGSQIHVTKPRSVLPRHFSFFKFKYRLPSISKSSSFLLSSKELTAIYHFPSHDQFRIEDMAENTSRNLPVPISVKSRTEIDVLIGESINMDKLSPIGLSQSERQRHTYIVGGTGSGKTTMLLYSIVQDIANGKGLAVIDPHGDLAESVIRHIPPQRLKDVIYLDPGDLDYPIGLNLLELPENLSGSALEHHKDLVAESVVSVLRKSFSDDDSGGHRIEYVLRNAIHTAFTVEGATIFTILKLLTESKFRYEIVEKLVDDDLRNFWKEELGRAGAMQRVKMSAGVTAKIGRFSRSIVASRMLGQAKSTINFDDIINDRKILICNLSKGKLGEDTSSLIGSTLLAKIQLSALKRQSIPIDKRLPFYLYVDEFQDFVSTPFLQMLSEARKYMLCLIMAEQSPAQQLNSYNNIILDNVATVVCFRLRADSESLLLPIFQPHLSIGDLANLPAYKYYVKISGLVSHQPFSGSTILLKDSTATSTAKTVIRSSRQNYASKHLINTVPKNNSSEVEKRIKVARYKSLNY